MDSGGTGDLKFLLALKQTQNEGALPADDEVERTIVGGVKRKDVGGQTFGARNSQRGKHRELLILHDLHRVSRFLFQTGNDLSGGVAQIHDGLILPSSICALRMFGKQRSQTTLLLPIQIPEFEVVKLHTGAMSARYDNSVDLVASWNIVCRKDQSVIDIDPQIFAVHNDQQGILLRLEPGVIASEAGFLRAADFEQRPCPLTVNAEFVGTELQRNAVRWSLGFKIKIELHRKIFSIQ